ncbi:unnamed protein product [Pleuronectes platessa]|uniref:Uncharacterized protein n=1 Tax=Pleuronectes platessa TaxID=8262 RepID=A0A9N7Y8D3_PLEPL|nr:unnamed protein product [Pleuronectes platessa]
MLTSALQGLTEPRRACGDRALHRQPARRRARAEAAQASILIKAVTRHVRQPHRGVGRTSISLAPTWLIPHVFRLHQSAFMHLMSPPLNACFSTPTLLIDTHTLHSRQKVAAEG